MANEQEYCRCTIPQPYRPGSVICVKCGTLIKSDVVSRLRAAAGEMSALSYPVTGVLKGALKSASEFEQKMAEAEAIKAAPSPMETTAPKDKGGWMSQPFTWSPEKGITVGGFMRYIPQTLEGKEITNDMAREAFRIADLPAPVAEGIVRALRYLKVDPYDVTNRSGKAPEGHTIIHFDFQPEPVILQAEGYYRARIVNGRVVFEKSTASHFDHVLPYANLKTVSESLSFSQRSAKPEHRPSFDWIWCEVAKLVAMRGTCPRMKVGAVIVDRYSNQIISTGYNGAPKDQEHCSESGCLIEPETGRCKRTVHAEANALLQAGKDAHEAILYTTNFPCVECANLIVNAGIDRVVYIDGYDSQPELSKAVEEMFDNANVSFERASANVR